MIRTRRKRKFTITRQGRLGRGKTAARAPRVVSRRVGKVKANQIGADAEQKPRLARTC